MKPTQKIKDNIVKMKELVAGESLADMLKAKGLAKDYDGEGARPEW